MFARRETPRQIALGLTAALALLAGCSEVQIDVDVYKGPLANHIDVQTEQIAVMAVGAEPLLIRLEREMCDRAFSDQYGSDFCEQKYKKDSGKAAFLEFRTVDCPETKTDACHLFDIVRGVRSLYFDLGELQSVLDRGFRAKLIKIEEILDRANRSYSIFDPDSYVNPTASQQALVRRLGLVKQGPNVSSLADEYRSFLQPSPGDSRRRWKPIFDAVQVLRADPKLRLQLQLNDERFTALQTIRRPSSNRMFEILSESSNLRPQARLLFPEDSAAQEMFVAEVGNVSRAYVQTRVAMAAALTRVLESIRDYGPYFNQLAKTSGNEDRALVVRELATIAVDFMHSRHLTVALTASNAEPKVRELAATLANEISAGGADPERLNPSLPRHSDEDQKAIRDALSGLLVREPERTASLLLLAQTSFISRQFRVGSGATPFGLIVEEEGGVRQRYQGDPLRRKYGLTRGPLDADFKARLARIRTTANRTASGFGGISDSFLRGRGETGLFRLAERWLRISASERSLPCAADRPCRTGETQADFDRRLLHDAMVRFAHRVLFVVNNESLFSNITDQTQSYVPVLQTVGNTILTHVDAMRQELAHGSQMEQAKDREAAAVRRVYSGEPEDIFNRFMTTLNSNLETWSTRATALRADLAAQRQALVQADAALNSAVAELAAANVAASGVSGPSAAVVSALSNLNRTHQILTVDDPPITVASDIASMIVNPTVMPPGLFNGILTIIQVQLNAQIRQSPLNSPSAAVKDLKLALSVLTTIVQPNLPAVVAGEDNLFRFQQILNVIDAEMLARRDQIQTANAQRKQAQDGVDAATRKHKDAKDARDLIQAAVNDLAKSLADAEAQQTAARHAVAEVATRRADVIETIPESDRGPYGKTMKSQLESLLMAAAAAATQPKKTELENAHRAVQALKPPTETPNNLGVDEPGADAKTVLDALIAQLRYEYLQAKGDSNEGAAAISRAAAALAESYRQRADMIYLRPAMAYLRTSFTATTLQDNHLAWRNMLTRHGLRSGIPFLPDLTETYNAENITVAEIDKQFWHNINRVRVAGAGDTNYAIAKDDVGNWYVKGYSTDVSDIVNSARSLAIFAAGANLPLGGSATPAAPDGGDAAQQGGQQAATDTTQRRLSREHELFARRFIDSSLSTLRDAQGTARAFQASVTTAWSQSFPDSQEKRDRLDPLAVPTAEERLTSQLLNLNIEELAEDEQRRAEAPLRLAEALRAIKLYHDRIVSAIFRLPETVEDSDVRFDNSDRARAARAVTDVVLRAHLKRLVDGSRQSAGEFAAALGIIGETAGQ